jgi:hypothetical protein
MSKIISFNSGHNIQTNRVHGSEAEMVQLCQNTYPERNGLFMGKNKKMENMSQCSYNAAQFLGDNIIPGTLIGLQEYVISDKWNFFEAIKDNSQIKDLKIIYSSNTYSTHDIVKIALVYDYSSFGHAEVILDTKISDPHPHKFGRPLLAVYFERIKLLVFNVHMPHFAQKIEIADEFYKAIKPIEHFLQNKSIERIVVMGDFNDYMNTIDSLLIKKMRLYKNLDVKTCCFDTDFNHVGDYIFDSLKNRKTLRFSEDLPLMSDHLPIVTF